jgi:hypothetical protein
MVKREVNPVRKTPRRVSQYGTTLSVKETERAFPIPAPRKHWPAFLTEDWWALWRGPHGTLFIISDVPGLRRLFDLRTEAESLMSRIQSLAEERESRTTRIDFIEETKADKRLKRSEEDVLWSLYLTLSKEVRELEDRYGLSPISRARVGLAFSEAKRAADEAARKAVEGEAGAEGAEDGEDEGDDGSRPDAFLPTSMPTATGQIVVDAFVKTNEPDSSTD